MIYKNARSQPALHGDVDKTSHRGPIFVCTLQASERVSSYVGDDYFQFHNGTYISIILIILQLVFERFKS